MYYSSSDDGGRTFRPNLQGNDRHTDRSIGVWSNNVDSQFNVGMASGEDIAHVAWHDSRNGRADTNAEDGYLASIHLDGTVASEPGRSGLPAGRGGVRAPRPAEGKRK